MKGENKMKVTLKDGSVKEYAQPMSVIDIAKDISEGLALSLIHISAARFWLKNTILSIKAVSPVRFAVPARWRLKGGR